MIRKARLTDAKQIQGLINSFAKKDLMLARSLNEIYENIRDFFVFTNAKEIMGTVALHISWEDLGEIKALAVKDRFQGKGVGLKLVKRALAEAKTLKLNRIFTLTYIPQFFKKFGFREIDKKSLPQKIWGECVNCVKFPNCTETALILKI
jgi:amino-acid N-acetyltransferase